MQQHAPTLAIVAVHAEENEPPKVWQQNFIISIISLEKSTCSKTRGPRANYSQGLRVVLVMIPTVSPLREVQGTVWVSKNLELYPKLFRHHKIHETYEI